jgi:hypothetical protein
VITIVKAVVVEAVRKVEISRPLRDFQVEWEPAFVTIMNGHFLVCGVQIWIVANERLTPVRVLSGTNSLGTPPKYSKAYDASFVPTFRQWPADPSRRGFLQVVMDCTLANRTSTGDLSLAQLQFEVEAQDFINLTHRHSPAVGLSRKAHRRNSLPV